MYMLCMNDFVIDLKHISLYRTIYFVIEHIPDIIKHNREKQFILENKVEKILKVQCCPKTRLDRAALQEFQENDKKWQDSRGHKKNN